MLNVDLVGSVPREREVDPGERAVPKRVLPFELIEEIVRVAPVAEEQPGPPGRAGGSALLHEGAKRRDAGARPDHDDVARRIRQAEMLVRLHPHAHRAAGSQPVRHVGGGDAGATPAVALVPHGGDEEMRLVADFLAGGRDRIGARRQRAGQGKEVVRCERRREGLHQIDELPALDPRLRLPVVDQAAHLGMAGLRREGLQGLEREGRDVALAHEGTAEGVLGGEPGHVQDGVDQSRIVFGKELEGVAGLISRRGPVEAQREMHGFLVGPRGVEVHVLDDFSLDRLAADLQRRPRGEIDRDDVVGRRTRRGDRLQRALDPDPGGRLEVEVAIDALHGAGAAERFEPRVDRLADGAELRIGRVAEGQHPEGHPIETRSALAHELAIGPDGPRRRLALAPGRGDRR